MLLKHYIQNNFGKKGLGFLTEHFDPSGPHHLTTVMFPPVGALGEEDFWMLMVQMYE
jgi:hypothetical protein